MVKNFRMSVREDLHKEVKVLSIHRRATGSVNASIGSIISEAFSEWFRLGKPDLAPYKTQPNLGFVQTTFGFRHSHDAKTYVQEIVQRTESNPKRRSGARLDREESDSILEWYLNKYYNESKEYTNA
jgi:hypothetical protein